MKEKEFDKLLEQVAKCQKCQNLKCGKKDCSLRNIYEQGDFAKEIPSIWTDWYNRLNAEIMVIGQDWEPYEEMEKFHILYKGDKTKENWRNLINQEKSLTKRMFTNYVKESASCKNEKECCIDTIYFTNAILCARKGNNYRGDNIALKISTENCIEFLKRQIEIVNPKIILTLGYYPLYALAKIYHFQIEENLTKSIDKIGAIKIGNMRIIPLYHPAAQIKKEVQLEQYKKIWDNV